MSRTWKASATVAANASQRLPALADEYFSEGHALLAQLRTPEALHRFRLKTKHFRYTMELFEEQYGKRFAELMKTLKPLQDALGEINDAATALTWLTEGESARAAKFLTARIASKTEAFAEYWAQTFAKPGERERWIAVLRKPLQLSARPLAKQGTTDK